MEETKIPAPNLITFELVTGKDRYYVVEGFIPPSDLTSLEHVTNAWIQCPKGCVPMLIGDLNVRLDAPRDKRDKTIMEQVDNLDYFGVHDTSVHAPATTQSPRQMDMDGGF